MRKNFTRLISRLTQSKKFIIALTSLMILAGSVYLMAAVVPVTAQTVIVSADRAVGGPSAAFTQLDPIVIQEENSGDFPNGNGTFTLTAPTGWVFRASGVEPTITAAGNNNAPNVSTGTVTYTSNIITIPFTVNNNNRIDRISIAGVALQAQAGTVMPVRPVSLSISGISVSGLTSPTTVANISQTHGSARKLAFSQEPTNTNIYAPIAAMGVLIQDWAGNTVTNAANNVSLTIANNPGGGNLTAGTTSRSEGTVTFLNYSIDAAGTGYGLSASASGLEPAISSVFNINSTQPVLDEIISACFTIGMPGQVITLRGSNFARNAVGRIGTSTRPTTFVSPTKLEMTLLESDMAIAGDKSINVLNPNPSGAASTGYIVTVHHTIQTASITGAPSLSGDAPVSVCSGTTRRFTAPSDFTDYVWTVGTGATVPSEIISSNVLNIRFDIEPPASGKVSFAVAATNPCGVRLTRSFEIEIRQTPPDEITYDSPLMFCEGGSVILKAPEATAGETPYTYQWRLGGVPIEGEVATSSTYKAEVAGSYSVVVSADNVCSNTSTPVTVSTTSTLTQGAITGGTAYCQLATVASADALAATVEGGIDDNGSTIRPRTYKWEQSTSASGPWEDARGANTSATYAPSTAEAGTMYYRRTVYAGGCESAPTAPIAVKVTPTINNEISAPTPVVCSGVAIDPLTGTLSGGDLNDVKYLWEQSASTSGPWVPAATEESRPNDQANYSPATETVTTSKTTYYRRKVASGSCISNSIPVSVRIIARPVATITQGTNTYFCPPGRAALTAQSVSGAAYIWYKVGESLPINEVSARTVSVDEAGEYYVVVTANGCSSQSNNITVQETVVGNNIINSQDQIVCYNEIPLKLEGTNATSTLGKVTYQWQQRTTPTGSFSLITDSTRVNLVLAAHTADRWYRRLATVGSCTVISDTIHIAVKPELKVTNIGSTAIPICTNTLFQFNPIGSVEGASFTWTRASVEGISNAAVTNGGGSINETLINITNAPIDVIYIYRTIGNDCIGEPQNLVVRVNPIPAINNVPTDAAICSGSAFDFTATNAVTGTTTYSWVRQPAEGITTTATSATGATARINQVLTNTTTSPVDVTYTYTLTTAGCSSTQDVVVRVNPKPALSSTLTPDAVCSGTAFTYTPESATAGATFTWTRASVTGISNTAVATPTAVGGGINETLINTTATPKVVTYRITASANGCPGTAELVQVTVNPSPVLNSPLTASTCSGATFSYTPTSATADVSFSWRRVASAGNAAANGDGAISEVLTNTTNSPITVTYEITTSANDCEGEPQNLVVTINPLPALSSPMTTTVCSGSPLAYTATSTVSGSTRYDWVRETVTGITTTTAVNGTTTSTTGASITHVLTNNTANPINVKYTFTLTTNGCAGPPQDVVVTVNPRPQLSSTLTPAAVCSGTAFTYTPESETVGATYTWTRAAVTNISNAAVITPVAGGINETLINTGTSPATVTYRFTTTYAPNGSTCSGSTEEVKVVVNPSPKLNSPLAVSICSGAPFSYTPASATTGTAFTWERQPVEGIAIEGPVSGSGVISQTFTNNTSSFVNVTYRVTSSANNCTGLTENVVVRVNPKPVATFIARVGTTEIGSVINSDGGNVTFTPTGATGGTFSVVSPSGLTGFTAGTSTATLIPCTALGTATTREVIIRYTVTVGSGNDACTNYEEKTFTLKRSTYRAIITTNPPVFCRGGGGTIYTTAVYRDPQPGDIIYPYLVNENGQPVDGSGALIPTGPGNFPIPNMAYPFPANTPESIKAMAFRFFQPIVSSELKARQVTPGSFSYQWGKNDEQNRKNDTYQTSDAGLSSQDYYEVEVRSTSLCSSVSIESNRIYSAVLEGYTVALTATPNPICQGGEVTFTATLGSGFPWSVANMKLDFVLSRGNVVLHNTTYSGSNTFTFTTDAAVAGGFMNGDQVTARFSTDVLDYLPSSNCINAPISNIITIAVQQAAAITAELDSPMASCVGNNVTFMVAATGTNVQYAWYKAGSATRLANSTGKISGATTSALTIANLTLADAGNYYVVVSNPTNSACSTPPVTSNQAALVVQSQPTAELVAPITSKCVEGTLTTFNLTGTTNYPAKWEVVTQPANGLANVSQTGVVTVSGSGTVRVRLTSENTSATGCNAATREVDLTVFPQPAATVLVEGESTSTKCLSTTTATYTVTGDYTGTTANWVLSNTSDFVIVNQSVANGVATATVRANRAGTATMTLNASNLATGCAPASSAVTLTANPLPLAKTFNNPSYCSLTSNGARVEVSDPQAGVDYQIVVNGLTRTLTVDSENKISVDNIPAGTYTIQGINKLTGCTNSSVGEVTVTDTKIIGAAGNITHKWVGPEKWELTAVADEVVGVTIPSDAVYNWLVKYPGADDFEPYPGSIHTQTIIVENLPVGTEVIATVVLADNCQLVQFVPGEIIPLPVELLYFNATKRGNDVVLDWATASELDNKGFEVQVSSDAKNFRALGFVESKVNTTSLKQLYTFVDKENGKQGVRYYRLKQVDLDGKFEIFNIKAVHFDEVSVNKVKAYPNPFHSEVELSIDAELDGELQITVTTATGQQLLQRSVQVAKGTNIEKLTLDPNLPRGVYIISTRMGDFNSHFKLLKQ
ncbi:PKD-like domain-containing protein [Pontibacter sp. HSC-36F09]|uniref:PKD-like domain-containing protein n=1 Tax=Pontibacter sp. HSC-36F09 TaxID=2910966 RepID=UPI00209D166C|nr:PKD-like domain-containing protein [Pontibacter sp. HSC-36F09]MCP2042022.1 hypothetical protein [Pontibacter sp. HSC-36F09]